MTRLATHLDKAKRFRATAEKIDDPASLVEIWFLSAYHYIEACAAKHRMHIQKHQRVAGELERNPTIFGKDTKRVVEAFRYLDNEARAKFVYGESGTEADLARARQSFETIMSVCERLLNEP